MLRKKIFVAGHRGMVGSAICRKLEMDDSVEIITKTKNELDLTNQKSVQDFFEHYKLDEVYLSAAKVGGIYANNTYPAEFIYENLLIEANVIHSAHQAGVNKLLFLGSSCIYPKFAPQPMKEDTLLTGVLESTNEPYAIAKIAGIKMCESYNRQYNRDYRCIMPTNLYGINDNFNLDNSHVVPALIRRFHEAKIQNLENVTVWGTGNPKREFLYVDDMASAAVHIMELDQKLYSEKCPPMLSHINVGTGEDCSIREIAEMIAQIIQYKGDIFFDSSKPDGTPRKLMDVDCIHSLGWKHNYSLQQGLQNTYEWFLKNYEASRK